MITKNISDNSREFFENGCCLVPQILSPDCLELLNVLVEVEEIYHSMGNSAQVAGSREIYNTSMMRVLNQILRKKLKTILDLQDLYSTYTFYRKYFRKQLLKKHQDRPECEISLTLCLDMDEPNNPWPVYFENPKQQTIYEGKPQIGDGILYLGCVIPHWREECNQKWVKQIFLHYSQHAELEFDSKSKDYNSGDNLLNHFIRHLVEC